MEYERPIEYFFDIENWKKIFSDIKDL